MKNDKLTVFIVTHKKFDSPIKENYIPLLVGANNKIELSEIYQGDNTGNNISDRNDAYSELTGLYWIWKNTTNEFVGLVHYRRYFVKGFFLRSGSRYYSFCPKSSYTILDKKDILELLSTCDVIVKESRIYKTTIEMLFINHGHVGLENWIRLRKTIENLSSDYLNTFDRLSQKHSLINCNMFIGKKELINKYCEWVFKILFEMDRSLTEVSGTVYHNREMGYFAEFLFGVWLEHNNINYKIVPAVNIDERESEDSVISFLRIPGMVVKKIKCNIRNSS